MFSASLKSVPNYDLYILDNLKSHFVTYYWCTRKTIRIFSGIFKLIIGVHEKRLGFFQEFLEKYIIINIYFGVIITTWRYFVRSSKIHFPSLTKGQKHEKQLCCLLNSPKKKFYSKSKYIRTCLQTETLNNPFDYLQNF